MNKTTIKKFGSYYDEESIPFQVRVMERTSLEYHIHVGDAITSQLDLEQGIAALYAAQENDQVIIHLNCDGGNADAGDSFLHAMGNCKAPIHVIASGRVASFGTFILLESHSFEISPFATLLFHSASYGSMGKMADTLEHAEFTYKQCEKLLRHYYDKFFSEEELDQIIRGKKEWYMDADEFVKRYQKRNELLQAEMEAEESEEVNDSSIPPITTEQIKSAAKAGDEQFKEWCTKQEGEGNESSYLYPVGEWIEWGKDEEPEFPDGTLVDVEWSDGGTSENESPVNLCWYDNYSKEVDSHYNATRFRVVSYN